MSFLVSRITQKLQKLVKGCGMGQRGTPYFLLQIRQIQESFFNIVRYRNLQHFWFLRELLIYTGPLFIKCVEDWCRSKDLDLVDWNVLLEWPSSCVDVMCLSCSVTMTEIIPTIWDWFTLSSRLKDLCNWRQSCCWGHLKEQQSLWHDSFVIGGLSLAVWLF